jgi:hypothetical protein
MVRFLELAAQQHHSRQSGQKREFPSNGNVSIVDGLIGLFSGFVIEFLACLPDPI